MTSIFEIWKSECQERNEEKNIVWSKNNEHSNEAIKTIAKNECAVTIEKDNEFEDQISKSTKKESANNHDEKEFDYNNDENEWKKEFVVHIVDMKWYWKNDDDCRIINDVETEYEKKMWKVRNIMRNMK